MKKIYITAAKRTAIGKFLGTIANLTPADIAIPVVKQITILKKRFVFGVIVAVTIISATSCGTITGLDSEVHIDSNPQDAEVMLNNQTVGITPLDVKLKNNTDYNLQLKLQGHPDYHRFVESNIS